MAVKRPRIKSINRCFNEVKRLTGDLLPDEQINKILDEIKIKTNQEKFTKAQEKTDSLLAEEVINQFEYEQALKKRNAADNNIKALDLFQKVKDAVALSEGRINAEMGIRGILVGIQELSLIHI